MASTSTVTGACVHNRMIVAGTFDILHDGHYALLHTAFAHGHHVEIWVTDDAMGVVKSAKCGQFIQPYAVRTAAVSAWCEAQTGSSLLTFATRCCPALLHMLPPPPQPADWLAAHPYVSRYSIHELHDAFGPSVTDGSYTAITCSEETAAGCEAINDKRAAAGMQPLQVVVAPLLTGPTGAKLSSTELRAARGSSAAANGSNSTGGGSSTGGS